MQEPSGVPAGRPSSLEESPLADRVPVSPLPGRGGTWQHMESLVHRLDVRGA